MIESFMCFRVTEKANEKAPDYRLTAKIGDEFVEIGAGWIKDGAKGKFVSFQMKKEYEGKPGFKIVQVETELPETSSESEDDGFGL